MTLSIPRAELSDLGASFAFQGTDPMTFELIKKVHLLQKRILRMSDDLIEKDKNLKDTERLYANLRTVLSRQSDPQATVNLHKAQDALHKRGIKLKVRERERGGGSTRYKHF